MIVGMLLLALLAVLVACTPFLLLVCELWSLPLPVDGVYVFPGWLGPWLPAAFACVPRLGGLDCGGSGGRVVVSLRFVEDPSRMTIAAPDFGAGCTGTAGTSSGRLGAAL